LSALAKRPLVYLITDGTLTTENFNERSAGVLHLIGSAAAAGLSLVQIREKRLTTKLLFELTSKAAELTRNSETKLLVNDRADVALAAGADGVHLAADSISPADVRAVFPADFIIGASTHSIDEVRLACERGADLAVFGPVFDSPGKGRPTGLAGLRSVVESLAPFPVLALGGVDGSNYRSVLDAGAAGFAAIRFLSSPENVESILTKLKSDSGR
jgi:thiamine-phosphate pyrophosphorylase